MVRLWAVTAVHKLSIDSGRRDTVAATATPHSPRSQFGSRAGLLDHLVRVSLEFFDLPNSGALPSVHRVFLAPGLEELLVLRRDDPEAGIDRPCPCRGSPGDASAGFWIGPDLRTWSAATVVKIRYTQQTPGRREEGANQGNSRRGDRQDMLARGLQWTIPG